MNCFQHAGLAAAVGTVKHINSAQARKLDLSQVSHGMNIKLCERHALYCFSLVCVVCWVVAVMYAQAPPRPSEAHWHNNIQRVAIL